MKLNNSFTQELTPVNGGQNQRQNHPATHKSSHLDFSDFIFQEDLPEMRLQTKIHTFSK